MKLRTRYDSNISERSESMSSNNISTRHDIHPPASSIQLPKLSPHDSTVAGVKLRTSDRNLSLSSKNITRWIQLPRFRVYNLVRWSSPELQLPQAISSTMASVLRLYKLVASNHPSLVLFAQVSQCRSHPKTRVGTVRHCCRFIWCRWCDRPASYRAPGQESWREYWCYYRRNQFWSNLRSSCALHASLFMEVRWTECGRD